MAKIEIVKNTYTVEPLYQWDINQDIEIYGLSLPYIPEIHFTNSTMDRAIVRQASINEAGVITARVPNSLLQKPYKIKAYVCIYEGETFRSLYAIEIPVKARSKPGDYTLENDEEIYSFNALENKVINALVEVEKAKTAYNEAKTTYNTAEELLKTALKTINNTVDDSVAESIAKIIDSTLTISGKAADAKAVGDIISTINKTLDSHGDDIEEIQENIINNAKFITGSYVGTDTYGADNPTEIPCPFQPKLLMFIYSRNPDTTGSLDPSATPQCFYCADLGETYVSKPWNSSKTCNLKYANGKISMYASSNEYQNNRDDFVYQYFIFG